MSGRFVEAIPFAGAALAATLVLARPSAAQCEVFGPLEPGGRISQASAYDQVWSTPVRAGGGWTIVWSAGQDIVLRRYTFELERLGNDLLVNTTLNAGQQDEPAVARATGGNVLVAWSERNGYDGQQMGIFARAYRADGLPIAPEFQVNQVGAASQWRPLIAPTPAGGFVVAWSGDWDGDAFFRILASTGTPLSGDVMVNQYELDAQVDPALAVAPDGTIFVAFVDFSSHGGVGSGLNLWFRRFAASGAPLADEAPLPATHAAGDQRAPRVAADAQNRFAVVWQDELADGSGYGVLMRRFASSGAALGADVLVNTTTAGAQVAPVVAADPDGSLLVAWEDWSTGVPRVRGRRYDAGGAPQGGEIELSAAGLHAELPSLGADPATGAVVIGYDVWNGADWDVHARRFQESAGPHAFCTAKVNSQGCTPSIGFSGAPSATSPIPFTLSASDVINNKFGVLAYGLASTFTPFQGGTLCVGGVRRTGSQNSGGNAGPPDCSGTFAFDFNAFVRSGTDPALVAGATVSAQWYYRDVMDPAGFGSGLTNAARFVICP